MSTEKELAVSHPGFWRSTLPLSETYVRSMNRSLERFARPMPPSFVEAGRRGIVNEAGFRAFTAAFGAGKPISGLDKSIIDVAWTRATIHVRTMRQYGRTPIEPEPRAGEFEEARVLAERIAAFFSRYERSGVVVEPLFDGCGWIDEARGDVLARQTLFEIKAGDRHFRSVDLHQLLTYCALNFVTKKFDITSVGLVNPRVGTFIILDLDDLCADCAGSSAADVMDEIVQYISEPFGDYRG